MYALIVIDAQNEFSPGGLVPVEGFDEAIAAVRRLVERAREDATPIAWIRHHNLPGEPERFLPGSWGAELLPGLGPQAGRPESEFTKCVFGAFTGAPLDRWLRERDVTEVLIAGFQTHMCVSTTAREALMRGYRVFVDPDATSTCDLHHAVLGRLPATEVKRSALLQLADMGVELSPAEARSRV